MAELALMEWITLHVLALRLFLDTGVKVIRYLCYRGDPLNLFFPGLNSGNGALLVKCKLKQTKAEIWKVARQLFIFQAAFFSLRATSCIPNNSYPIRETVRAGFNIFIFIFNSILFELATCFFFKLNIYLFNIYHLLRT